MIPDHLSCQTLVEQVTDWMDGGLDPEQRAELELHLVTCVGCTAYVEQLRHTSDAVAATAAADEPVSDEVRGNLLDLFRSRRPPGGDPGDGGGVS